MNKINIYIDGNNLYRGAKELGFDIDITFLNEQYHKFSQTGLLKEKAPDVDIST